MSDAARAEVAAIVGEEVMAALAALHVTPTDAARITGLPSEVTDRATFRIRLADGRVVKARRLTWAAKGRRFAALLGALSHPRLPPPLLVEGRVAIEEWVDGTPVSTLPPSRERLVQAADLLGSIHAPATADGGGRRNTTATSALLASTRRRVGALATRGAITRAEAFAVLEGVRRFAPCEAEVGVTHNDFCAENLVEDTQGRLFLVDNEGLRRGFLDYDLGRTWYRWPMADADWSTFLARYGTWRALPADVDRTPFWRLAAVVKSAHLRAVRRSAGAATPIGRLHALLAELAR